MSYVSQQQLIERFGERMLVQLTDRADPPSGSIDSAVVDRALSDTDAAIDGYLAGRYALPLAATPPLLADLAASIAIYKLHIYAPDAKVDADYKDAISTLVKITTGIVTLPVAGIQPASSGAAGVEFTDRPRDFTPENLRGFV